MDDPTPAPPHHRGAGSATSTAPDGRDLADATGALARPSRRRRLWPVVVDHLLAFLELFALAGFVVAQPLLDVLGRSPDFLLFRQADARDIVLLAVAFTLAPPVALRAVELLAGVLGRRVRWLVHLALVAGLLGLLGLEVAKKLTPLGSPALVAVGALVGGGGGLLYARGAAVRRWLRWLWPAPIVFLLVFLLLSPAAELLRSTPARDPARPGTAQSSGKGPIVMVLMDEFPLMSLLDHRGQIDRRLYPNFARLAGGSTWYRNATAVNGLTQWALPSLMTGRYPAQDRLPIASQYPDNLFTLLGESYHYKLHVFEGTSQLCPPASCPDAKKSGSNGGLLGQAPRGRGGVREVLRDSVKVWTEIASPREPTRDPVATLQEATVDAAAGPDASADPSRRAQIVKSYTRGIGFQRFLSSLRPTDRDQRALYFVHVLVPHQPWKYLPSGMRYRERTTGPGRLVTNGRWTPEAWPVEAIHQRHLMQTAIADRMIGELTKRLRATGLYDRSLLVVTADHGMAFTPSESGRASPINATAPDVLWVPLLIKRPGQRTSSTSDANWEHVDLVPTIADIMGFRVPWSLDGVSWADPSAARRQRTEKWFYPTPGTRRTYEGPAHHATVLQGTTDRLLRPKDGYLGWFKFGPHADLVGRRVRNLTIAGGAGMARVIGLDDYQHVDPSSGWVPANVAGQLTRTTPGTPPRPAIVVAVNGVIGGVSETFVSGESPPTWFTTMVPDTLLRRGENQLQLFLLATSGGQQRLHPLSLTG
jgi:arylsulfatase A-like enzyme